MSVTAADLTKLYLAYFGRPPDFDGVQFYVGPADAHLPGVGSDSIPVSAVIAPVPHPPRAHRLVEHWRHRRKRGAPA